MSLLVLASILTVCLARQVAPKPVNGGSTSGAALSHSRSGGGSGGGGRFSPPGGTNVQISSPSSAAQTAPSIAVDPTDPLHLMATAYDARQFANQAAFYASFDGGSSWSEWFDNGQSGLPAAAFGSGGELYLCTDHVAASGYPALFVGRSYDGGLSVPSWTTVIAFDKFSGADKPVLAVDRSNGPHAGNVYLACGVFSAFGTSAIEVMVSADGGASWSGKSVSDTQSGTVADASLAIDSAGVVHVTYTNITKGKIYADSSTDGGLSWGRDVFVADAKYFVLPHDPNHNNVLPIPNLAADTSGGPYDGNLYLVWAQDDGSGDGDVVLTTSSDGGATWSTPMLASDVATNSQYTPCVDVDPNGNVNIAFYDCREDPNNGRVHLYVSRSADGGKTVHPNVRVSDVDFPPTYHTSGYEDHVGIAGSGQAVHAIWTDSRNGDNDIFGASVALDFSTDVAQLSAATGGTVVFTVEPGPLWQNDAYWIVGSASGTTPGIDFSLVHLPLNYDLLMIWTLLLANSPALPGFSGTLDATGAASASLVSGPLPPSLVGLQLDFAVLVKAGSAFRWASDATHLEIGN